MKEEEIEFFETRIPILRRHYVLVSEFNGQINEEETKKLFIYIRQLRKDNRKLEEENKSLQSQLKAKEEENEQLKADYGNLAQVERDFLKEVIKEAREKLKSYITFCENDSQGVHEVCNMAIRKYKNIDKILSKGEYK